VCKGRSSQSSVGNRLAPAEYAGRYVLLDTARPLTVGGRQAGLINSELLG
jgi:hypothetical protein